MHARTTVTVPRVDGPPDVHHGAPCSGVWGLVRGYGEAECWCIVHVPTGRTVWRVASPALALAMLDELGLMVPAYEADRALGEAVDGHTREAKRVRRLIATMAIHWEHVEDQHWPEALR